MNEEENPQNSQVPRTKGDIFLGPRENLQVKYKFTPLNTAKTFFRHSWDLITMPDTVITRVNALGGDQLKQLTFTDRYSLLVGDV